MPFRAAASPFRAALAAVALCGLSCAALGGETRQLDIQPVRPEAAKAEPAKPEAVSVARAEPGLTEAQRYCMNVAPAAADARFAWQTKQLNELEAKIRDRIAELQAKQAEYQDWVSRRESALKHASDSLVGIYSHMRPETAAAQLSALDDETAVAVLTQLTPRNASAILNEMETARAARLANAMAGNVPMPAADGKKS